jgi:CheY-like chemotaxis protein
MDNPKILIIDDRSFDRILYKELLGEESYDFDELDDGDKVMGYLAENPNPDLILLDWQMPRKGGLETLKYIKQKNYNENIPVIIITGQKDEEVLKEAFDEGCIDFIHKPVNQIELASRVQNVRKLYNAQRLLRQQKNELQELNDIIKIQKDELKESLLIKNQLAEAKEANLSKEIENKNRKMVSQEVDVTKVMNNLNSIKNDIAKCTEDAKEVDAEGKLSRRLKSIERNVEDVLSFINSKDDFKELFENIDPDFYKKLSKINPKLTPLDLKHCAYIKMNVDNYELTQILNIEMKSIQMTRYRLKKKLKLSESQTLREFIFGL